MYLFNVLAAEGGWFDLLNTKIGEGTSLVRNGVVLVAMVVVASVYVKTKALVPTLGALLLSGVVVWGVYNTDVLRDKTGAELEGSAPAVVVVPNDVGPGPGLVVVDDG